MAGIAVGVAITTAFAVLMLKTQGCDAFIWDRQSKTFIWQNLQTYQCAEASQRIATQGILTVGPQINSFYSADGRVRNARLSMTDEGIRQGLQGHFVGQHDGRAHSYRVAVNGVLVAADGRQQIYAWAIEPEQGVVSPNGR